jgi:putative membrane protein
MIYLKFRANTLYYYINERFFSLVLLGAIGFFLLAAVTIMSISKKGHDHGNEDHDHHHDHAHPSGNPWVLVITAIPLLLGILVPSKPLDASVIESRGVSNEALISSAGNNSGLELSTPADQRTILDWIRSFNYSEDPTEFWGETADVIGFVYQDPRLAPNQFLISRLAITCCVADAFAIGMVVDWDQASEWTNNSWVHVRGEVQAIELNGEIIPLIVAESIKETDEPAQPYLFP